MTRIATKKPAMITAMITATITARVLALAAAGSLRASHISFISFVPSLHGLLPAPTTGVVLADTVQPHFSSVAGVGQSEDKRKSSVSQKRHLGLCEGRITVAAPTLSRGAALLFRGGRRWWSPDLAHWSCCASTSLSIA